MIEIKSSSGARNDQKKLLENISKGLLEEWICMDRAEISGKGISLQCSDEKKAFRLLKGLYGVESIIFNQKEAKGRGGLPEGSRGKVLLDRKKYRKFAERAGFSVVEEGYDAVVTDNIEKFKREGILALDFSYCSIL